MKRILSAALALMMALALSSCLTIGADRELRLRINNLEADNIQLKRNVEELRAQLQTVKDAPKPKPLADEALTGIRNSQTMLLGQINDMVKELQSIEGRFDERTVALERSIKQLGADVDMVKAASEGKKNSGAAELEARVGKLETDMSAMKAKPATTTASTPAPVAAEKPAPKADSEAAYKAAYTLFVNKKYSEARAKMEAFIKANPNHELTGNAYFWVAESYYNEKGYKDSILAYEDVIQKFPKHSKVPSALLKQAYAFIAIGDKESAKANLKTIVAQHPKSDVADTASKKLSTLK